MQTIIIRLAGRCGLALAVLVTLGVTAVPGRTAPVSVTAAGTAQIVANPATVSPGSAITITGANWHPGEVVSLSFGLQPLANVGAQADGSLPATSVVVPLSAGTGLRHIVAFGQTSRHFAFAAVTVAALRPTIRINGHNPPVALFDPGRSMCVDGQGFGPAETIVVQVDAGYVATGPADGAGAFDLCFAVPQNVVTGANTVKVVGLQSHATVTLGFNALLPAADTQYLVGGSTIGGDTTTVPLLNSGTLTTTITLTFYTHRRAPTTDSVVLAPHSSTVIPANAYVPAGQAFGVRVQADKAIATQMVVRRANKAPYAVTGTRNLATTAYLAGGTTTGTFHEILYLLNPQSVDATARIQVVPAGGGKVRTLVAVVAANHSAAFELNRVYPGQSISAIVHSDQPLVTSRVLTFGPRLFGANAAMAVTAPATKWVFPTASVAAHAQTALAVYNASGSKKATLTLTMYDAAGTRLFVHTERILPQKHVDIDLNTLLLGTAAMTRTEGFQIVADSNAPLFLERSYYSNTPDTARASSIFSSVPPPAPHWTFAGGDTSGGANETMTIANPNKALASVRVTFIGANGLTTPLNVVLAPGNRTIVDVPIQAPAVPRAPHGIEVASSGNTPITIEVAETAAGDAASYVTFGSSSAR